MQLHWKHGPTAAKLVYPSIRDGPSVTSASSVRAKALQLQSFAVGIKREAHVPLVIHGFSGRGSEEPSLLVECLDALWKRDATEIHQGGWTRRRET